jgi:phosphoglycolate phosphatase-like HAD superfamily hydrolase
MPKRMAKKKLSKAKNNNHQVKYLVLVDHDGTLCDTNPIAYESIKYAFRLTVETLKLQVNTDIDWDKVFSETRGTTEKSLARYLSYLCGIPFDKTETFEKRFFHLRARWYENMRLEKEYVWDTYFPDAHQLVYKMSKRSEYALWLVTGNPKEVLKERLANSLLEIFSNKKGELMGVFGDRAYTRKELIELALAEAAQTIEGFKIERDSLGFAKNVFYLADSRSDFFAGIEAKVRTVWVPSRSLQTVIDTKTQDYVRFIKETLGDERMLITNDLYSQEAQRFMGLVNGKAEE